MVAETSALIAPAGLTACSLDDDLVLVGELGPDLRVIEASREARVRLETRLYVLGASERPSC